MAIAILDQDVFNGIPDVATYTFSFNTVPVGTTRLLVLVEHRGWGSGLAPPITSVTHNGDPVTWRIDNQTGGFNEINTWWGERLNPDTGIHDVVVTFSAITRGCKCWVLAISGELASGPIFGARELKRTNATNTNTFGLGITPTTSGDSLILASLGISVNTTLTSFTGTGFTLVETGTYSTQSLHTSTSRYRNGTSGAVTVSAVFGASYTDLGGSLVEIFSEPTSSNVSGSFTTNLAMTGSVVAGLTTARLASADFRNEARAWSELLTIQADTISTVNRRLITTGPATAPNLMVDQVYQGLAPATNSVWRWQYRLTDGQVVVESAAGTQSVFPLHLGMVHAPGDPGLYVQGTRSASSVVNGQLTGTLDVGSGGIAIAGHEQATPQSYTGLIGRYLVRRDALSAAQMRLMAVATIDPDAIWAYGEEDSEFDPNFSPMAFPMQELLVGEVSRVLRPKITDPLGSELTITSVVQPTNGTLTVAGDNTLIYRPNVGWVGDDTATYTVSDGLGKSSTGKIRLRQIAVGLQAKGDNITVIKNGSVIFDPRANDTGSGPLVTVSVGLPTFGTALVQNDNLIKYTPNTDYVGSDSFTYTVRDSFATVSATVTVVVTSSSFVQASGDTVSAQQGNLVTISPLDNDNVSADLSPLVISAVTTPSPSGSAVIASTQKTISYTPASSFTGTVTFNYTARSSVNASFQSTAAITVNMTPIPTGGGLPITTNNVTISASGNLRENFQDAYDEAAADTTIWLQPGTYPGTGTYQLNRTPTGLSSTKPIIVRPLNNAWDKVIFQGGINLSGPDHIVAGINLTNVGAAAEGATVYISGSRSRFTRCKVHRTLTTSMIGIAITGGSDIRVDRNDIKTEFGGGGKSMCIRCEHSKNLPPRPVIEYNWIHDCNGGATSDNGHEGIQIGEGSADGDKTVGAIVRFNLLERVTNESETISVKSSGNTLTNNIGIGSRRFSSRSGARNRWEACRNDDIFMLWGESHTYIGCVANGNGSFHLEQGNCTVAFYNTQQVHLAQHNRPAPTSCSLFHCGGDVKIAGGSVGSSPPLNNTIQSHNPGTVDFVSSNHSGTKLTGTAPGTKPPIVDLFGGKTAATNVGQWAPFGEGNQPAPAPAPTPTPTDNWWKLPIRSGRDWAAGTAYWYDRTSPTDNATPRFTAEEADVALIDAIAGSSKGDGFTSIGTLNEVFGRTSGGADDFTDTQFDWRPVNWYGLGNGLQWLPTGPAYPDGSGWIFWVMSFVPTNRSTAGGDSSIWDEYIAGTHDALLIEFGDRFKRKCDATGHPRARFIIDAHHEMNQSNVFQIFAGTRTKYKNAMQRIINKVREGAGYHVRFCHRPAYRVDAGDTKIGDYNTFVPNNVDVLALSIHPAGDCNTDAKVDQLFAGTLNENYYGTDELVATAASMSLPIAFPEWSPKYELTAGGGGCPKSNTFVTRFYNNVLVPNKAILVADCVYHQNIRDTDAYEPADSAGIAQWAAMVPNRKTLWSGIKS